MSRQFSASAASLCLPTALRIAAEHGNHNDTPANDASLVHYCHLPD